MVPLNTYQACSPAEDLQTSQGRDHHFARRARKATSVWRVGTWNVRSMVDTEGPIEVASQNAKRGEDRKVDQVVCNLERYGVMVAALQETKWFGCEIYEVNGSVVLTSGRRTPGEGVTVQRGEGVALVLRGLALTAWERGGKQWKAWSSRCVSAILQLGRNARNRFHVVS